MDISTGILYFIYIYIYIIGIFGRGAGRAAALPSLPNSMFFRAEVIFLGQEHGHQIHKFFLKIYGVYYCENEFYTFSDKFSKIIFSNLLWLLIARMKH